MEGIPASMQLYPQAWASWIHHDNPYKAEMPDEYDVKLTSFTKLALVKALRQDRGIVSVVSFIGGCLGYELRGVVASALIDRCSQSGDWVLLQNCHLAKSWMPALEKILQGLRLDPSDVNDAFRLFVTSFPASYFPISILQSSVKITNEPPKGLKPNLLRSFEMVITDDALGQCAKPAWKQLVFGLCFFHAVLQERSKFGPMGWTLPYHFNDSDLETALSVLRTFLNENDHIPWEALHYVTGEINYGGRVTDEFDRRCLVTNLQRFYSPVILDDNGSARFFTRSSELYFAPTQCHTAVAFRDFIELLPSHDTPDLFGLHENANIVFQTHETNALFVTAMDLQSRGATSASSVSLVEDNGDAAVLQIAAQVDSLLPALLGNELTAQSGLVVDSLATVLGQEMVKFNTLLRVVQVSITQLQLAVKGVVTMTEGLDSTYKSLLLQQVPPEWHKVGFASLKPLAAWLVDVVDRVEFFRQWLQNGSPPPTFPLPYFFFPQGFLTSLLQNHARKHVLPINTLEFTFEVDPADLAVVDGAIVTGLFLEGGRWDDQRKLLCDAKPNEMLSVLPPVHFLPYVVTFGDAPSAGPRYECPVYKTTARRGTLSTTGISSNFVISVHLPCEHTAAYWVLNGTALIGNLNQ
ncbi:hypothetical protein DYB30_013442 [Aphanomyces astaci]|uniref:Dynein heavy chain C-terminal domain-containing protein n=1 Tax=Aphanomyces astaci TaxID=112090 RepID=A0A397EE50_APHAT|nr:hypothetical protein DYB30_013442 [Aphanomyces astaci]